MVLPTDNTSTISITGKQTAKIKRGTVVAVGEPSVTKFGASVSPTAQVDNDVLYLSYEETGGYDEVKVDGVLYNIVEFLDLRGVINV